MEYLYEKLESYARESYYGFHMPGHKQNEKVTGAALPYRIDITEIDGFDDLHHPKGLLKEAQKRAADLFGAEETYYLVNGSTVGLLSAVAGCTTRRGKILVARNCHKSVYNAVFLNELEPVYLYPEVITEAMINGPVKLDSVMKEVEENPDIQAVVITSPTYEGVVSDVKKIAEYLHTKSIPLIVDQAHGAHFGMHPYFPMNANAEGADVVIQSVHKTLPALTQTALLHINGNLVIRENIRKYLSIFQSSSPSYVLMASIDECIRILSDNRNLIFESYTNLLRSTRERLKNLKVLKLIETEKCDRSKLVLSVRNAYLKNGKEIIKYTGKRLYNELKEKYLLQMEMAAPYHVLAMTAPGDTADGMERLVSALEEIDGKLSKFEENAGIRSFKKKAEKQSRICSPYTADLLYAYGRTGKISCADRQLFSENGINTEKGFILSVPFEESAGNTALEYAYAYPPGIPLIVPGERITEETVRMIRDYMADGLEIKGTKSQGKTEVWVNG